MKHRTIKIIAFLIALAFIMAMSGCSSTVAESYVIITTSDGQVVRLTSPVTDSNTAFEKGPTQIFLQSEKSTATLEFHCGSCGKTTTNDNLLAFSGNYGCWYCTDGGYFYIDIINPNPAFN